MPKGHIKIGKYKIHHHHLLMFVIISSLVIIGVLASKGVFLLNAATSPWNQTDWSAGVGGSTTDQFASSTNIDFTNSGEIALEKSSALDWYNTSWLHRRKIVFNNTDANIGVTSQALVDFSFPVKFTDGVNIDYAKTQNAGQDIRFTDCDGTTELSYQIEKWDELGESLVWVKVPQIDQNSSTDCIYTYYNNVAATDGQGVTSNVWSDNYKLVYHMNEAETVQATDSSPKGNNIAASGTPNQPKSATGQLSLGRLTGRDETTGNNTRGFSNFNTLDFDLEGKTSFTVSLWLNRQNDFSTATGEIIYFAGNTGGGTSGQRDIYLSLVNGTMGSPGISTNYFVPKNTWVKFTISYDSPNNLMYLYGNNELVSTTTYSTVNFSPLGFNVNRLGVRFNGTQRFGAYLDEVRIIAEHRTRAELNAEYLAETSGFTSYQAEVGYYKTSATLLSNIFDTEQKSDWGNITYTVSGSGLTLKARSGAQANLSDADNFNTCDAITSGTDLTDNDCVYDSDRYIQYQVDLTSDGGTTPVLTDVSLVFSPSELTDPDVNATSVEISGVSEGDWINYEPTFTWDDATDNLGGSGILGYCLALEEATIESPTNLDPEITSGVLGSDNLRWGFCPYIVTTTSLDVSAVTGLDLTSNKQYYLSVRAIDNSGNIFDSGDVNDYRNLFSFKHDNVPPTNPTYVSLPGNFVSSKDVTLTWPVASGGADDDASLVAGLQYKIGDSGTWMGDLHLGTEDLTDLLNNDGSYTTDVTTDYPVILDGLNNLYLRTLDNAGNISSSNLSAVLKINTNAPSEPQNLTVSETPRTENDYSFSWEPPATFTGSVNGITYCYTINELPSLSTCNYTSPGSLSLASDAYANQPGNNVFRIAARDEAFNINYSVFTSVNFEYTGDAPGMPQNLSIADVSIKDQSDWRLVVSWIEPSSLGAGVSNYKVYRSTTEATCSSNPGAFSEVGTTTSPSKIFSDTGLTQQTYYYCVKACDNANNCGAYSSTVNLLPTGKFTVPASLITEPSVSAVSTQKAVINWVTERASDSRIEYGLSSGQYFDEEVGSSAQVSAHTVTLNNLTAGTTYYFRAKWSDEDGNTGISEEKTFVTSPPPQLIEVSSSSVTVSSALIQFTSSSAYKAIVFYGKSTSFGSSQEINISPNQSTYTISLTELDDETKYYYTISLIDLEGVTYPGDTYSLTTLAKPRVENITIEEQKDTASPTVSVVWTTNVNTTSILAYREEGSSDDELQVINIDPTTEHSLEIVGLKPTTNYELRVRGVDGFGNIAESSLFKFTTATDNRAPLISNVIVESNIVNNSASGESRAQLIVSWETDEPSTSLVAFGEGSIGAYTQTSQSDLNFKQKHVIIINDLNFSTVYSLQIQTRDQADNERKGSNFIAITPNKTENALDLVIINLRDIFGFLNF